MGFSKLYDNLLYSSVIAGMEIQHIEAILNKEVQQASARLEILYEDDLTEGDTYGDE